MKTVMGIFGLGVLCVVAACGGQAASGSDALIAKTFAGQNRCNPENHERPFIIEWDATDQSSFQALASSNVVVVRYEGCKLTVLDGCANDSVKGSLGAYRPIDWTSGQLESVDIDDENELYAKLPLGAASLGGRVQRGDKFHMEYFVSGTRTATRSSLHRADLDKIPACKEATHFVYAYNLGAFALASKSALKGETGGSYFGFGASGRTSSQSAAEKKGGSLASCQASAAKEIDGCKAPIRLALRPISAGESADAKAARAADTPESVNLAGAVRADADRQKQADEHARSAREKQIAGDGNGCLAELDQHDRLDPSPSTSSSSPKGGDLARLRAKCVMLSGQCDAGKDLLRKVIDAQGIQDPRYSAQNVLDEAVGEFCRSQSASSRDQYTHAFWVLEMGKAGTRSFAAAECEAAYQTILRLQQSGEAIEGVKRRDARLPGQEMGSDWVFGSYSSGGWKRAAEKCAANGH